jgi:hypothetical protein
MCKNTVVPKRPWTTIQHDAEKVSFACWITKATDTHSENVTLIASFH